MSTEEQIEKQREGRRRTEIERSAGRLASFMVEEYTTVLREKVQVQAEALRRHVSQNAHRRAVALEAIDLFEHYVIRLVPPTTRWARARIKERR